MKVLVTGAGGFVGKKVIANLKSKNYEIRALGKIDLKDPTLAWANICYRPPLDALIHCAGFTGSVNFANQHAGEMFYNNVLINTNTMEAARQGNVKRYINILSNCIYPNSSEPFKEENLMHGSIHCSAMGYGYAKITSYFQALAYHRQYGMDIVSVILPNIYGPGEHFNYEKSHALGAIIQTIVRAKKKNQDKVILRGTGAPIREWLYVEDAAEGIVRCLDIEPTTEPINIGCGESLSIAELADIVKREMDWEGEIEWDASQVVELIGEGAIFVGLLVHSAATASDVSKSRKMVHVS